MMTAGGGRNTCAWGAGVAAFLLLAALQVVLWTHPYHDYFGIDHTALTSADDLGRVSGGGGSGRDAGVYGGGRAGSVAGTEEAHPAAAAAAANSIDGGSGGGGGGKGKREKRGRNTKSKNGGGARHKKPKAPKSPLPPSPGKKLTSAVPIELPKAADACTTFAHLDLQALMTEPPIVWRRPPTDPDSKRLIGTNHKTGTFLAKCMCGLLRTAGEECRVVFEHTQGEGLVESNYCINMVRNPFDVVASSLEYHRTTDNFHESWLWKDVDHMAKLYGVPQAVRAYRGWCLPQKMELPSNKSYQDNVRALPLREALVLEALRALSCDIPRMLRAATRCVQVEEAAAASSPRTGGCRNLDLATAMKNFSNTYSKFLEPAFDLDFPQGAEDFVEQCDPTSKAAPAKSKQHMTTHGTQRASELDMLRTLDKVYLGGALHAAENMLIPLVKASGFYDDAGK